MLKYDNNQNGRVVSAFANSFGLKDRNGGYYSLTTRKKVIAEEEGLKLSDVDRILYGRELAVEGLSIAQERVAVQLYNTRKDLSVKKLAIELSDKFGKKISKDTLYKILYEMDTRENNVVWRGSPKSLANYHARKSKLEEAVEQEPKTIRIEEAKKEPSKLKKYLAWAAAAVLVPAASFFSTCDYYLYSRGQLSKPVAMESLSPQMQAEIPSPKPLSRSFAINLPIPLSTKNAYLTAVVGQPISNHVKAIIKETSSRVDPNTIDKATQAVAILGQTTIVQDNFVDISPNNYKIRNGTNTFERPLGLKGNIDPFMLFNTAKTIENHPNLEGTIAASN